MWSSNDDKPQVVSFKRAWPWLLLITVLFIGGAIWLDQPAKPQPGSIDDIMREVRSTEQH